MENLYPGNSGAWDGIRRYLQSENPGCLILKGPQGCGKGAAARGVAASLLDCPPNDLPKAVDFYCIDKGGETVKVEDVESLLERSTITSLRERKVFLILESDITPQAQNRLLKLLEDRNDKNLVIFACSNDTLIPTIKSRCRTIDFHRLSEGEMADYLLQNGVEEEDIPMVAHLCECCPRLLETVRDELPYLRAVYEGLSRVTKRGDLLPLLGMVKEKDAQCFYETVRRKDTGLSFFSYVYQRILFHKLGLAKHEELYAFAKLYRETEAYAVLKRVLEHKRMAKGHYNKNDFFDLVRYMIAVKEPSIE